MKKTLLAIIVFNITACLDSNLPQESHFKSDKGIGCDTVQLTREIILNLKRGLLDEAQKQIDTGVAAGTCAVYYKNEVIILTDYDNGYYKFHIKGTDDTPKRSFYTSSQLVNNF